MYFPQVIQVLPADAHTLAELSPPTDLSGLVRLTERRNLVSARVPSHFNCTLPMLHSVLQPRPLRKSYIACIFFIIYNLTNDCTIISNTIITNSMLVHVSTFKMSSSGSSLCLSKNTYRFSGLSKRKFLKYKMLNFNKTLVVQRNKRFT